MEACVHTHVCRREEETKEKNLRLGEREKQSSFIQYTCVSIGINIYIKSKQISMQNRRFHINVPWLLAQEKERRKPSRTTLMQYS